MADFFWENENWEGGDKDLRKLAKGPFQRPFPFMPTKPGLYVIRGPRQVGKSTWLKSILSHHRKNKRKCFYFSSEELVDFRELYELLKSVQDRDVILIDEISFVLEWWRAVKKFIDSGFDNILVVTGSHSYDLKRGLDFMPGRWGAGGESHLLPMDFNEFLAARRQAGWSTSNWQGELSIYFRVGGFPTAVVEGGANGHFPQKSLETYGRWLLGDTLKLGKQELYLKQILGQIALTTQSPLSLQKLAQRTQMGSHHTAQEYISLLEHCFALKTLYAVDPNTAMLKIRSERKYYFTDPLLFWLALSWNGLKVEDPLPAIAELTAHEHLSRRFLGFGYLKTKDGEIDFYQPRQWAIEVKWAPIALHLSEANKKSVVPLKMVWTQQNFLKEFP